MRRETLSELIKTILDSGGGNSITIRQEDDGNGNVTVIITVRVTEQNI